MTRKEIAKQHTVPVKFVNCVCRDKDGDIIVVADHETHWIMSAIKVINHIDNGTKVFYVEGVGFTPSIIATKRKHKDYSFKYLYTMPDGITENNLQELPQICKKFKLY